MTGKEAYYGNPQSVAAMKRSAALWSLVRDDPRFAYYGRLVGLSQPVDDTADVLAALARVQGAAPCYFFPKTQTPALFAELEAKGLSTDRHEHFLGGEDACAASRQALSDYAMPADLTVRELDADTPGDVVAETADLMESCEVMPVPAAMLRGQRRNGACLVATDEAGRPVATASSFFMHPADGPHGTTVFWGMLATRPDRRGEKIALLLGARMIVHMWEKKGARAFMTGVRESNASSTALCNRLGVYDTACTYAVCVDAETMGRKSVTK